MSYEELLVKLDRLRYNGIYAREFCGLDSDVESLRCTSQEIARIEEVIHDALVYRNQDLQSDGSTDFTYYECIEHSTLVKFRIFEVDGCRVYCDLVLKIKIK